MKKQAVCLIFIILCISLSACSPAGKDTGVRPPSTEPSEAEVCRYNLRFYAQTQETSGDIGIYATTPVCPSGGEYLFDGEEWYCTAHDSAE